MTPASTRLLANVLYAIGIIILLVTVSGMFGWTPKLPQSFVFVLVSAVFVTAARGIRRRAREPQP
jgi:hypothetical protein